MRLYREEWLGVIGSAILVAGLAVLGAFLATDVAATGGGGKAIVVQGQRIIGSEANSFFFSASSRYAVAFWVMLGILAAFTVVYVVAGLMRRREEARVERQAPLETLRPAEQEAESRRKAA
jgi:hypothetical protein